MLAYIPAPWIIWDWFFFSWLPWLFVGKISLILLLRESHGWSEFSHSDTAMFEILGLVHHPFRMSEHGGGIKMATWFRNIMILWLNMMKHQMLGVSPYFFQTNPFGLGIGYTPAFFRGGNDAGMPLDLEVFSYLLLVKLVIYISHDIIHYHTISIYIYIYPSIFYNYWWSPKKGLGNHQITPGRWPKWLAGTRWSRLWRKPSDEPSKALESGIWCGCPATAFWLMWIDEDSKILLREHVLRYNSIVYIYMIIWLYTYIYIFVIIYDYIWLYVIIYDYIYMFGAIYYM